MPNQLRALEPRWCGVWSKTELRSKEVAAGFGVCERTARKWMKRHAAATGLEDHRLTGPRQVRAHGKIGWEFVFVAIDDCSRLAFAEICSD